MHIAASDKRAVIVCRCPFLVTFLGKQKSDNNKIAVFYFANYLMKKCPFLFCLDTILRLRSGWNKKDWPITQPIFFSHLPVIKLWSINRLPDHHDIYGGIVYSFSPQGFFTRRLYCIFWPGGKLHITVRISLCHCFIKYILVKGCYRAFCYWWCVVQSVTGYHHLFIIINVGCFFYQLFW